MSEKFNRASFEALETKQGKERKSFVDSAHKEALEMQPLVENADKLGLTGAAKEAFITGRITYDPECNYIRPLKGVTENQIMQFIEQVPVLEKYCDCGSSMMSRKLLEAIIKKNPKVDLTDIDERWGKLAYKLSAGQSRFDDQERYMERDKTEEEKRQIKQKIKGFLTPEEWEKIRHSLE